MVTRDLVGALRGFSGMDMLWRCLFIGLEGGDSNVGDIGGSWTAKWAPRYNRTNERTSSNDYKAFDRFNRRCRSGVDRDIFGLANGYNCFAMSPSLQVLAWAAALHRPGRVTPSAHPIIPRKSLCVSRYVNFCLPSPAHHAKPPRRFNNRLGLPSALIGG